MTARANERNGDDGEPSDQRRRGFTLDDIGNARRFVAEHGSDFRYVATLPFPWLRWDGRRWVPDTLCHHRELAKKTADKLLAGSRADTYRWRHANRSRQLQRLLAMLQLAQTDPVIAREATAFDADPFLLNVGNGTVDLRTGELREHRREDHLTLIAGGNFDPTAKGPLWKAFIEDIFPDAEVRGYVQRLFGLAACGVTLEHVLAIFWGSGANGKTTLLGAIREALGEYAHEAPVAALTGTRRAGGASPELADLRGRRLVTVSESREDARLSVERVKVLTGGDPITARYLYRQPFTFQPSHTIVLQTNHRPRVRDDGHAIWRRLQLVPFMQTIPSERQRRELLQELAGERDAILSWVVAGALAYRDVGLDIPAAVTAATNEYRHDEDVIGAWLEERCERLADAWTSSAALRDSYAEWARSNGADPLTVQALAERLKGRDFVSVRQRVGGAPLARGYRGIALRPSEHPQPHPGAHHADEEWDQ